MATVAGTGSVSLNVGSNKLNITVNVGGLGARVYTLTINRQNKTQPQTETIKETSSSQETKISRPFRADSTTSAGTNTLIRLLNRLTIGSCIRPL